MTTTTTSASSVTGSVTGSVTVSKHPELDVINGQVARFVPSPLATWEGGIYVPRELTPQQWDHYWRETQAQKRVKVEANGDRASDEAYSWKVRFPLVLRWHLREKHPGTAVLEGTSGQCGVTEEASSLPSIRVLLFAVAATQPLLEEAQSLPNLASSSKTISAGTETSS